MMKFQLPDFVIVFTYLLTVTVLGLFLGRKQKDIGDYFLGGRNLPWLAVCFSVVATETSTLTFISIPGLAYLTNLNILQVTFGYLLGRILVSFILLPAYFRGQLSTSYEFLNHRFGSATQSYASFVFHVTRLLADGVRLFATAIPLSLITGWNYPLCIFVITIFTLVYTFLGGIRSVVWMDVIQTFVYIGGGAVTILFLSRTIPDGWSAIFQFAHTHQKLNIFYLGFDKPAGDFFRINYTLFSGLIGGLFLSMASHGTDQLIVQRLLACENLSKSRKALIASGVFVILQFLLFLLIGVGLFAFYSGASIHPDQVFPRFIVDVMPRGLSGILLAAIFAAAMSTLSSSLNALASSSVQDFYKPRWGQHTSTRTDLLVSRSLTLFWGFLFMAGAMLFKDRENPLVELGLAIASFTYGGMLGIFFLGVLDSKPEQDDALCALWSAIFFMTWLIGLKGSVFYIILSVNILTGIWIWTELKYRINRIYLVFMMISLLLITSFLQPYRIAWPWYVPAGSLFTLISTYPVYKIRNWRSGREGRLTSA